MSTLTPTCLHDLTTIAIPRHARWDSDADILVVMPFEGSSLEQRLTMLELAAPSFPVDLLLCRPEAAVQRYGWGDPFIREALDHGEVLHG